jgi:hypothetical protein
VFRISGSVDIRLDDRAYQKCPLLQFEGYHEPSMLVAVMGSGALDVESVDFPYSQNQA